MGQVKIAIPPYTFLLLENQLLHSLAQQNTAPPEIWSLKSQFTTNYVLKTLSDSPRLKLSCLSSIGHRLTEQESTQ